MAITNYTDLKSEMADWLDRDDLTTDIPNFIALAEQQIARNIKPNGFERVVTSTMTANDPVISRPTRLKVVRWFRLTDGNASDPMLKRRPYSFLREYWPDSSSTGTPKYYSDYGPNFFLVAPTPNSADAFEIGYFERLNPLSDSNTTNWLTENAPDLILYASLLQASPYLKNDPRIQTWNAFYDEISQQIMEEDKRFRTDEAS